MSKRLRTRDGFDLELHEWLPAERKPTLVVALVHGYGEHAGRYREFALALNAHGIGVVAVDLRGHGRSSGVRGHIERFSEYHHDLESLLAHARTFNVPVAVFGHSMGALLVCDWLLSGPSATDAPIGVALSSPFLGLALKVNPVKSGLGRLMSRAIPTLSLPSGLKGSDACRDPELQRLYDSDPLNNKSATSRWFTEAMAAIERVHSRAGQLSGRRILLLFGGEDRIASPDATQRFADSLRGVSTFSAERLAGHYHELLNEPIPVRQGLYERYARWFLGLA